MKKVVKKETSSENDQNIKENEEKQESSDDKPKNETVQSCNEEKTEIVSEEHMNGIVEEKTLNNSTDSTNEKSSPILFNSEVPYRSRYGRLHKSSLNPDMEFVPLFRKKTTPVKSSPAKVQESSQILTSVKRNISFSNNTEHSPNNENNITDGCSNNDTAVVSEEPVNKKLKLTLPKEKNSLEEKDVPCDWLVGDLLWSKIPGHPWWPSMISFDPILGIYTKVVNGVGSGKKLHRIYHVQYFGPDAERSWTVPHGSMPFEGHTKYNEYVEKLLQSAPPKGTMRQKLLSKFKIKSNRKDAWLLAVEEAEDALKMTRTERKQQLTFEYINTKKTSTKKDLYRSASVYHTPDLKSSKNSDSVVKSPKFTSDSSAKRQKHVNVKNNNVDNVQSNHKQVKPIQVSRKKKSKGQFSVFLHKHLPIARLQHPDFSEEALEEYLHLHWDRMTEVERARYTSRLSINNTRENHNKDGETKRKEKVINASKKQSFSELEKEQSMELETDKSSQDLEKQPPPESEVVPESKVMSEPAKQNSLNSEATHNADFAKKKLQTLLKSQRVTKKALLKQEKQNSLNSSEHFGKDKKLNKNVVDLNGSSLLSKTEIQEAEPNDLSPSESSSLQDPLDSSEFSIPISTRHERICQICENVGDIIVCKGPCQQSFHPACLGLTQLPSNFQCDECITGKHTCFSCKKDNGTTIKCSSNHCGKYYHEECMKKYPLTSKLEGQSLTCPLHSCLTCCAENSKIYRQRKKWSIRSQNCLSNRKNMLNILRSCNSLIECNKARIIRCIRCPVAYHSGDNCISAGSVYINSTQIICANHFQPKKGKQYQSRINASWCFICSIGGSLICCESCPAAFHIECLAIPHPEESYYCDECIAGKHPRYGNIVWVKLGCYRWWPAKICHPKNVPLNIQNMSHDVGDFPVQFFGSHDYYWTHKGRVFLFQEGDKGSKEHSVNRNLAKIFQKAVEEANEAFQSWQVAKEAKEAQENGSKPPSYKFIKSNKPVGKVQIHPFDLSHINRCECDPNSENPCGEDSDCLNRMTMVECHPNICPAGERCQNQRFQKREYVPAAFFKTEKRGWGLKTLEDVKKGQFVNEYVGELIDEEECERRLQQKHEDNDTNYYFLTLDKDRIIDAGPKGNLARFMNHSCQPNCETQKWMVNADTRVGLFALCDIPAGTELTFNYNLDCRGNEKSKCTCGAPICSGYIGVRPKTVAASQDKKARESAGKRKKRRSQARKHEDECFRCGEGGELVMCDRKSCPKSYHLNCLALSKPPYGRWECPWHHCDECGKSSVVMCSECPNSFCKDHGTKVNISKKGDHFICHEHKENASAAPQDRSPDENEKTNCSVLLLEAGHRQTNNVDHPES
ncbi:LOW QUALITY PROTEIN: histone-lysine N-methyltransferase NSD2 [Centruroides vittatus]|uniref:LOW QUALITY PROTEIN: histone-lysine N-methyltransferase NSD2 n=1 Tax=Centruroides vittatus TaxID=120091 RepID=UPI00350EB109